MFQYVEESGYTENIVTNDLHEAEAKAVEILKTIHPSATLFEWDPEAETWDRVESVTAEIDPTPPECEEDKEHDWQSPHEVVGGIEENPGVWGNAGGVIVTEVCAHCGAYKVTNTWDQSEGPEPVTTIQYKEPDERSLEWVNEDPED